jgi:hypothetical protein
VTISVFAVILNNALNNSTFFSYKKVIDSDKVAGRLLMYYGIVFLIQFVMLIFFENVTYAIKNFIGSMYFSGFIVVVSCVRLSRFKLIKDRWQKLKIELPFAFSQGDPYGMRSSRATLRIKGESYNEASINVFYEEYFYLIPISNRTTYLGYERLTFIERKLFLKNDETFYLAKVFHDGEDGEHTKLLLKAKTNDATMVSDKYPIVAVLEMDSLSEIENTALSSGDFTFKEWAYIKPRETA